MTSDDIDDTDGGEGDASAPGGGAVATDPCILGRLVCPLTRAPLAYDATRQELVSRAARLAYPIRDGVPLMVPDEARRLEEDDPALKRR